MAFLKKATQYTYQFLFSERTILFVTNKGIKTIKVGLFTQAFALVTLCWISNLFIQSLRYDNIITAKSNEISRLETVNGHFGQEVEIVNDKLKKINEYLVSITGFQQDEGQKKLDPTPPEGLKSEDLSRHDLETLLQLRLAEARILDIQNIAQARIDKIQEAILVAGLNLKNIPPQELLPQTEKVAFLSTTHLSKTGQGGPLLDDNIVGQGGPIQDDGLIDADIAAASSDEDLERHLDKVQFLNQLDHLIVLEKVVNIVPFSKPMQDYYISSGFGSRVDPVTGHKAKHRGLDFVGPLNEEILSPSQGKVILAGKYNDYGNAIVIDHGFGITTRYGHLSEVKVKKGQLVKKGEIIALQGSTGRSTGPHLHYEVRYKNNPLDPRKFLKAGNFLFNETKT